MSILEIAKYLFMGIFILFFIMDIVSKKSYKIHYFTSITIAVAFTVLVKDWSTEIKIGFITLFILLTMKTIIDEKKLVSNKKG